MGNLNKFTFKFRTGKFALKILLGILISFGLYMAIFLIIASIYKFYWTLWLPIPLSFEIALIGIVRSCGNFYIKKRDANLAIMLRSVPYLTTKITIIFPYI